MAIPAPRSPSRLVPLRPDLNKAPGHELVLLPGVGPTRAGAIVDSRRSDGAFDGPDDLERVRGIGPKTVAGLRDFVLPPTEAGP